MAGRIEPTSPAESASRGGGAKGVHHRIEIVHESLLTHWPQLLRWRAQDADGLRLRDQLDQAARLWEERGRPDDLLWTETSFKEYELWRERYEGGLTGQEREFAAAMEARAERRKRRRHVAVAALVVLSLGIAALTGGLWLRSETARQQAVLETRHAEASNLIALGRLELETDPTTALAYALASLRLTDTAAGRRFAMEALWRGPIAFVLDEGQAFGAKFSPDGNWLASGGTEGRLDLWSRSDGSARRLIGHLGNTQPVAFDASGTHLVSSEQRRAHTFKRWSLPEAELGTTIDLGDLSSLEGYPCADGERFVTLDVGSDGSGDVLFKTWPIDLTGEPARLLRLPLGSGWRSWAVDPFCRWLAYVPHAVATESGGGDREIRVVAFDEPHTSWVAGHHAEPIDELGFDATGDQLIAADAAGEIRFWPVHGAVEPGVGITGAPGVLSLALDPLRRWLAASGADQVTRLWDLTRPADAAPILLQLGDRGYVYQALFSPDSRWIATAAAQGTSIWPLRPDLPWVLRGHTGSVQGVRFLAGGAELATVSDDATVRLWALDSSDPHQTIRAFQGAWDLDLDTEGRQFVFPQFGWIALATREDLRGLVGLEHNIFSAAIDPSGRFVAAAGGRDVPADAPIRLWDLDTSEWQIDETSGLPIAPPTRELASDDGAPIWALRFIDRDRLLSGGTGGVRLWTISDGASTELSTQVTTRLSVSADGRFALAKTEAGTTAPGRAQLYDLDSGRSRFLDTHGERVRSVGISAGGEIVVTGDIDGAIRVGPASGDGPHVLFGHDGPVTAVAISPDGEWVASGGQDKTVRLWPMPDLDESPLHSLPHDELLARLEALTNVRVVRDAEAAEGWGVEVAPFTGWSEVPKW